MPTALAAFAESHADTEQQIDERRAAVENRVG
jgi:hypothetical protein